MADTRQERIARNEASYREMNEAIRAGQTSDPLMLLCECGEERCTLPLYIPAARYEAVREHPRRFLVLEDHEIPDAETVVERHGGWLVVEKDESVAEVVEARDPRRSP